MSIIVNLAHVRSMAGITVNGSKTDQVQVSYMGDDELLFQFIEPARNISVYGEGEMLVTRWLKQVAGETEEASDA